MSLNQKQLNALALLSVGNNQKEVGRLLGITPKTIQRWQKLPEFQKAAETFEKRDTAPGQIHSSDLLDNQMQLIATYLETQKWFAQQLREIASKLVPICVKQLDKIETGEEEISIKMLPQLLKNLSELADKLAECHSRATGIETVLTKLNHK